MKRYLMTKEERAKENKKLNHALRDLKSKKKKGKYSKQSDKTVNQKDGNYIARQYYEDFIFPMKHFRSI